MGEALRRVYATLASEPVPHLNWASVLIVTIFTIVVMILSWLERGFYLGELLGVPFAWVIFLLPFIGAHWVTTKLMLLWEWRFETSHE